MLPVASFEAAKPRKKFVFIFSFMEKGAIVLVMSVRPCPHFFLQENALSVTHCSE
jgi:hypothetical protein